MTLNPRPKRETSRDENKLDRAWQEASAEALGKDLPTQESPPITGKELRRARRRARQLGLEFRDDHEALALLRQRGIEPGGTDSVLNLMPHHRVKQDTPEDTGIVMPVEPDITDASDPMGRESEERAGEINRMRRALVRRRRGRLAVFWLKLAAFVILPTFLVGHYYYTTATEMYETEAEFVIQKSEAQAGGAGLGGLFSGTGFATSQDSITVQGYLQSREAMQRLNTDHGFVAHFSNDAIDSIQRLPEDASLEDAYSLYGRKVSVGFDPTEGVIRMKVIATDAESAKRFNDALIDYAEERVDNLSARVRRDQMAGAQESYTRADGDLKAAQNRVLELQQRRGVLSAEAEISAQMAIINSLEMEREKKALDLAQILSNPRPNETRAGILRAELDRIEQRITELRGAMTQSKGTQQSLARITAELRVAEADLTNRQIMLQSALQQMETARIEANRQVRYLSLGVSPVATDTASYPRRLENTALAFVIFLSIYILVSLTASILREQVSV